MRLPALRSAFATAALLAFSLPAAAADPPPAILFNPSAPTPAAMFSPAPTSAPSPVSGIRNKLSAADLLSAESMLEVHEQRHGRDLSWLEGLGWLARGAWMLGEPAKAKRYADDACRECETRIAKGADLVKETAIANALGASIEVEAQRRQREFGTRRAARYLEEQLARWSRPVTLRSRLQKRLNLMTMVGKPAPDLVLEDSLGGTAGRVAVPRGKPVVLFLWAEWCGDCKSQAAALARVKSKYAAQGLEVVGLTRYYGADSQATERARVDSVWAAAYSEVGEIPRIYSTASMERYGGSATPTFVFVNREGVVSDYTPTRLTEAELDRRVAAVVR